ncbi:protein phosphatase 2C domain-containing protein [Lipingzhangella sp. LS1_29]|uniref:Protein phosphatase 2C domain-containing protein n=1 Tax=Lipingzhangella rawalii TaxID=2055835 RepID=A0ABU2H3L8_9ACTN|nr:protein phosphatase 2C domain-containing protein [Lipingzhangella rawalii]MDS1269902.1 protein phosphatase 2C domain-containing protein [Lipingzhangella rawalii]
MGVDSGTVTVTALTHRGAVRQVNEDALVMGALTVAGGSMNAPARCLLPVQEPLVLAVADGLGGHAAGEIASEHAVHRMAESGPQLIGPDAMTTLLTHIDDEIREHSVQNEEFSGMGTTVAGLLLTEEGIYWFNVGDSRTYRIRDLRLEQLSEDDSPPTVPGEDGRPTSTNFITQSLGGSSSTPMQPHVGQDREATAEGWLMCSDGLSDLVSNEEMEQILAAAVSDEAAVRELWQAAMKVSGRDNISILLARPY